MSETAVEALIRRALKPERKSSYDGTATVCRLARCAKCGWPMRHHLQQKERAGR